MTLGILDAMNRMILRRLYIGILALIFGLIVLHAPLIVIAGTIFPAASEFVKSWKEILMLIAAVIAIILVTKHQRWKSLIKDKLAWVIIAYVVLHLVTIAFMSQGNLATLAGLAIDLRYILFFTLVYVAVQLYPTIRTLIIKIGVIGAAVVTGFAAMQIFLPKDILTHIGYGDTTIAPYNTVDLNDDYVRVNSTLRGPNPLGAYAAMVLTIVMSFFVVQYRKIKSQRHMYLALLFILFSIVALWVSYSRSALLAAFVGVVIVLLYTLGKKIHIIGWIGLGALAIVITTTGYVVAKDNVFVSNVVLHENPSEGGAIDSNDGHLDSLRYGIAKMLEQPFGAGVGSTGTASYHATSMGPTIIENQYLFIAHEVGWLGLVLFLVIFIEVMRRLWKRRSDWLAMGVFASGIGMALIGVLLPVWVDDTVSLIWWGLAAVVIGGMNGGTIHKAAKRTA